VHIVVCLNHIPDPEAPPKQFKVDEQSNRALVDKMNRVIGPFDENALETALQLKDTVGAKITAVTVGPNTNQEALRRALGVKCDAAIHVKEEQATTFDSWSIAALLAAAIRKIGAVDLILCGRQVGDWDSGQVGQLIAEELQISCVTLGQKIELMGNQIRVTREVPGGLAITESDLPAVVTITNTPSNQLRIPKVRDTMAAFRIPITAWSVSDLGVDPVAIQQEQSRVLLRRLFVPEANVQVEMITGDDDEQIAENLATKILALKVI
jgi:electron transfer flavoprotein beta subunit